MERIVQSQKPSRVFRQLLLLGALVLPTGILAGSASALFLWLLDLATAAFQQEGRLLFLLPLAGVVITLGYHHFGKSSEKGNNLILEQIHGAEDGRIPVRMAPLVLAGTLLTHLFGGSAGREGTAVQMGASLADFYRRLMRLPVRYQRILLMSGISAGFGSVFGTPVAGAIFALEVLVIGRVQYDALVPVLIAGVVGDLTCSAWGIHHTSYHINSGHISPLDLSVLAMVAAAGGVFGLVSRFFSEGVHRLQHFWNKNIRVFWLRPVVGAAMIILLVHLLGTRDYLGLGVSGPDPDAVTILSAFQPGGADALSWFWKLLFTAITLSCGFKGGEVTPLFFIGATLGNAFATFTGMPVDLFAGLGLIAVFAGASNTPLACTLLGVELFGGYYTLHFALACFIAYFLSGHAGIYRSQQIGTPKW